MNKIKAFLVDDEPLALTVLESLLQKFENVEIVGTANSTNGLQEKLNELKPDVLFSDIQMPGQTGLEFIKEVYPMPYAIVFTTAYPNFAADAFEFEALDYMLKPISPDRLAKAVKRLEEYVEYRTNNNELADTKDDYVYVKVDGEHQKIHFKEIHHVEAFADYVKIWTGPDKRVVTLQTMRNMENGLPEDMFLRVHRSFIVAINKIRLIQNASLVLEGDIEIPIGKNYKDSVLEILKKKKF